MNTVLAKRHRLLTDAVYQALALWSVFFVTNIFINGTIPFVLGGDLLSWSQSREKFLLVGFVIYAMLFLVVPLILVKGWGTVRQGSFILPLGLAVIAITLSLVVPGIHAIALAAIAFLHWRFDLSGMGLRSRGLNGDLIAIFIIGALGLAPVLMTSSPRSFLPGEAVLAGIERLFANPGSSIENMFYFGFLTERLSLRTKKWLTPLLIGLMYVAHEMTNPEYWYEQVNFAMIFIGVSILAAIYLWRRNVVPIWLGDGLMRFAGKLLG